MCINQKVPLSQTQAMMMGTAILYNEREILDKVFQSQGIEVDCEGYKYLNLETGEFEKEKK